MPAKLGTRKAPGLVVARVGDRAFRVPERFTFATHGPGGADDDAPLLWEVEATIEVADGAARFREVTVRQYGDGAALTPLELQRLPWGRLAEAALEATARSSTGETDYSGVRSARATARKAAARRARSPQARRPIDLERLREVVELRAEAKAAGARRWDEYAAERMGYAPITVRKMYGKAKREGLTDGEH